MVSRIISRLKQWSVFSVATPLLLTPSIVLAPFSKLKSRQFLILWSKTLAKYALNLNCVVEDNSTINQASNLLSGHTTSNNNKSGTLYVHLNQQTLLSVVLYNLSLPPTALPIMNIEFAMLPFIGWTYLALGSVAIIRQLPESAKRQLQKSVTSLKNGEDLVISIEGKRTLDGNLSPYKKGPVIMAIEAQCDIVPFMTHGEWALWPRGNYSVLPGGKIDCILYPRISTVGMTYADRDRVVSQLRSLAEREKQRWEDDNWDYLKEVKLRDGYDIVNI